MTIDVEAEAAAVRERSSALIELLGAASPAVDRTPLTPVRAEAARLAMLAKAARADVADKLAAGLAPGVPVGRQPPIRRVRTDGRGRDLDPLHGRPVISSQLLDYWTYQRDAVGPAIENVYRDALTARPHSAALVAAVRGHLGLLRLRQSNRFELGEELAAALTVYEASYTTLRDGINDGQHVATEAQDRLANLDRAKAEALIGDGSTQISGLIASAVATAMPDAVVGIDGSTIGTTISK